jgi:hypothetical protein
MFGRSVSSQDPIAVHTGKDLALQTPPKHFTVSDPERSNPGWQWNLPTKLLLLLCLAP